MTDLRKFIDKEKNFYKSIVSVSCPILNDTVYFTSEGFNHLIFESNRVPRKATEQYLKLKCLQYAPDVITKCTQVSDIRRSTRKVKGKVKAVTYYELVHKCSNGEKMQVIVEKVGQGKLHFKSVMPNGRKSHKKTKNTR